MVTMIPRISNTPSPESVIRDSCRRGGEQRNVDAAEYDEDREDVLDERETVAKDRVQNGSGPEDEQVEAGVEAASPEHQRAQQQHARSRRD